jgi:hypothetical protein
MKSRDSVGGYEDRRRLVRGLNRWADQGAAGLHSNPELCVKAPKLLELLVVRIDLGNFGLGLVFDCVEIGPSRAQVTLVIEKRDKVGGPERRLSYVPCQTFDLSQN